MRNLGILLLLLLIASVTALDQSKEDRLKKCGCKAPTPCEGVRDDISGICAIPLVDDITKCPADYRDCRDFGQQLCEWKVKAEKGFCCFTACSSLAPLRHCGEAPHGFEFERTGLRDGQECHDPLNVREECCLHEKHIMKSVTPQAKACPKTGTDLAELFATIDGNRDSSPNRDISPTEVLHSLKWLDSKGFLFLAHNFSHIDLNHNHKLSWYEVEYFCGHSGLRLPAADILQVKPSEITMILSNPILVAALLSSLVLGETFAIFQAIGKHCLRMEASGDESGILMKIFYPCLSVIWPCVYNTFQIYYFFCKISWEVCDGVEARHVRLRYLGMVVLNCCVNLNHLRLWVGRKCAASPSIDLGRRIFVQQILFRKQGLWFQYLFICLNCSVASFMFIRAVFYGSLMDIDFAGLETCRREDPDMDLLYKVNERFFLWSLVQGSLVAVYVVSGWGIDGREYEQIPTHEELSSLDRVKEVDQVLDKEREKWRWFD